jgi:hypothetical protein
VTSTPVPDVHRHRAADPSPRDAAFLRGFLVSLLVFSAFLALLVYLTDPLGLFGVGLVPPVVSADRDYKAGLYRRGQPSEVLILGSSRVKTLAPECVRRLTGRAAFNFGVNGGGSDDLLAVYRFARTTFPGRLRQLIIGVDPETLEEDEGRNRALLESGALAVWNPAGAGRAHRAGVADLLSSESVLAAVHSLRHLTLERGALPQEMLGPDGAQSYPVWDDEIRRGAFPQQDRVLGSIPGVLGRYTSFQALSTRKVSYLRTLVETARDDSVEVVGYIPPVHPALARAALGSGVLQARQADTERLLQELAGERLLRYVPVSTLASFGGDSTLFYDAIHMMPENSARLLAALYGRPGGCALQ